jgi:hypothetical protein
MNIIYLSQIEKEEQFIQRCVNRITRGMMNCNFQIIPLRNSIEVSNVEKYFPGFCNYYERGRQLL